MSNEVNITDITVHLHPESSCDDREKMEQMLRSLNGVVSVHFNTDEHPHTVVVAYNPDAISSEKVLTEIRTCDPAAMMVGL